MNTSKIKAAGKNFTTIGFTMLLGIVISIYQIVYSLNIDLNSRNDLDSLKLTNSIFMALYIGCTIIIIWNFIRAGINLASIEETKNSILESETAELKSHLDSTLTGELSEGGIIVYSIENGNSLVCSLVDLGKTNWNDAKKLCEDYREGGFADWRMPNQDELLLIYSMLHKRKITSDFKTQDKSGYWCSNDINKNDAIEIHFGSGDQGIYKKSLSNYVRAVRTFKNGN
jgi:hypothetical protein